MKKTRSMTLILISLLLTSYIYANNSVPADNSAKNTRDQSGKTPQPIDQPNSERDLAVAVKIRSNLYNDKQLSTYGKNVKVIALNNVVTLRGPVNSQAEKQKIGNVANLAAPGMKIQNDLEIINVK